MILLNENHQWSKIFSVKVQAARVKWGVKGYGMAARNPVVWIVETLIWIIDETLKIDSEEIQKLLEGLKSQWKIDPKSFTKSHGEWKISVTSDPFIGPTHTLTELTLESVQIRAFDLIAEFPNINKWILQEVFGEIIFLPNLLEETFGIEWNKWETFNFDTQSYFESGA